jgi:twinkle protein
LGEGKTLKDLPKLSVKPKKSKEEVLGEMEFISSLPSLDLPSRKLSSKMLGVFGIKVGVSEEDGTTPAFAYFPYTKEGEVVKYKVKHLPSGKVWSVGVDNEVDLFGWEQAKASGAKRLIIVEGEFDAPALVKILLNYTKEQYKEMLPAVCSIPNGAASAKRDLSRLMPTIRKHFKLQDISLCFDDDKAGREATEEVCKVFPGVKVITLPDKDANDCLLNGKGKAAFSAAMFRGEEAKNTRIVWGESVHEAAKKPAVRGFSWPWPHVDEATKGIRLGETIYIGAAPKMGKSEIVDCLGAHFIKEHGWKVLMAKPEQANVMTYKRVAGKLTGKFFHDPDKPFDTEAYEEAGKLLKHNLAMLNLYQHLGFETLKQDIYAAANAGCKSIFIDPITNLVNGMNSADQNTKLQEIAQDLSALALDLDVVMFIFCHLRNPDAGPPHERGGKVESNQFAGSRAMARSCNLMFGLEGNRDPDLPIEQRNLRHLVLLEDREFGNAGRYPLYWDNTTGLFNTVYE